MPRLKVETVHGPRDGARSSRACAAYNIARDRQVRVIKPLTVTLRERGKIVGGLAGETFSAGCSSALFWVSDKYRGKGFGSKLMQAAEKEAAQAWRQAMSISTPSASRRPAFYAKLGYREFGRLKDFPAGHYRIWLTKAL